MCDDACELAEPAEASSQSIVHAAVAREDGRRHSACGAYRAPSARRGSHERGDCLRRRLELHQDDQVLFVRTDGRARGSQRVRRRSHGARRRCSRGVAAGHVLVLEQRTASRPPILVVTI